ncbi:hypothetical protein VOLCADRAFT_107202 [Volvox carteri f. nagariensis]|uniref:Uncharacterized protein n=1 Tax=Volvox carteri f. nagariensis TaxID=3068 RepID=D8UCK4_VOLCA|nr:uncharacterized protein VOLCADRAFT_107202 [Volvox carteri f. nagariensis]EFJ42567.1 hypothetical protein VOLCADRAFT_107202 [Volvox carteri f. nagariensis]|eukprot:XP_002956423.1 hypothetical protein VOLCADRAFT_107202 [Volvox carteri f. nagariensis]
MARTCQADDALEKQFETLLKHQAGPEVGLLVGKHATGAKSLLYGTIRTPIQDGFDPIAISGVSDGSSGAGASSKASKKASGRTGGSGAPSGGAAVSLEVEWITEHARQVARMLPGVITSPSASGGCLGRKGGQGPCGALRPDQLCGLLAGLASFCLPSRHPVAPAAATHTTASGGDEQQHLLLLHIDASSRRQALRALAVSAASAAVSAQTLRPVDMRFAPVLGSLVLLRCWHGVDLALPVAAASAAAGGGGVGGGGSLAAAAATGGRGGGGGGGVEMRRQLAALVAGEAERIRLVRLSISLLNAFVKAEAMRGVFVAGDGDTLPPDSAPVGEALSASGYNSGSVSGSGPVAVVLRVPTFDLTFLAPPLCQQLDPVPQHHYHHHHHYHQRTEQQPQHQGEEQQDSADAGAGVGSPDCGSGGSGGAVAVVGQARLRGCIQGLALVNRRELVGRAVAELKGGALALCDYLLEGELAEAAAERAAELLALRDSPQVLEYEQPATVAAAAASGPWRPNAVPGEELQAGKAKTKASTGGGTASSGSLVSGLSCSGTVLASLAVAAVASAVGMLSLLGPQSSQ